MHAWGAEGPLNRWLQDNYELSYHLPVPSWGALLLLLIPLAILVLYFLKLKRKPLSVPSTFLWRKSIEDLHVNSLLQWLRENVLLLLQLLTLLALIYSLMGFRFHGRAGQGRHYVLMIDNSASMGATDVAPSRLEQAKAEALKEIDAVTDSDFGMVIAFNSRAEILQSFTSNRGLLRQAVKDIPQTQRPTRIEEALSLADSFANPIRSTEDVASQPENVEPGKERTYVDAQGSQHDGPPVFRRAVPRSFGGRPGEHEFPPRGQRVGAGKHRSSIPSGRGAWPRKRGQRRHRYFQRPP